MDLVCLGFLEIEFLDLIRNLYVFVTSYMFLKLLILFGRDA